MTTASDGGSKARMAYLDSSMIVAMALAIDLHHTGAIRTYEALREGGYRLVTSRLAVMEAVGAVRKKITVLHRHRSGSEEERAGVDAEAARAVEDMLGFIGNLVKRGTLRIAEPSGWSPDFTLLYGRVIEHTGRAVHSGKGRTYRYRGVGSCDWLHFLLARYLGASVICTADAAFADIEGNDGEFGHIRIQMVGGPLIAGVL